MYVHTYAYEYIEVCVYSYMCIFVHASLRVFVCVCMWLPPRLLGSLHASDTPGIQLVTARCWGTS